MAFRSGPHPQKKKRRVIPLLPLARRWMRGPVWRDGDNVVMDCQHAIAYEPLAEKLVGIELSHVQTAEDAVAFAQRFGLLTSTGDWSGLLIPQDPPAEAREPVKAFITAAADLRGIIATLRDVQRAVKGDAATLARMRQEWKGVRITGIAGRRPWESDRELLIVASDWAAWGLHNGLTSAHAWPYIYDRAHMGEAVDPGSLRIGILPETLLGVCYLTVAFILADKEPLDLCRECGRAFIPVDARQKFCRPACANRSRLRRFGEKHALNTQKEGSQHGKTTRTK